MSGHTWRSMPTYTLENGQTIETSDPRVIIEAVAAHGPFGTTPDTFLSGLKERSEMLTGTALTSDEPAEIVDYLVSAGVIERAA